MFRRGATWVMPALIIGTLGAMVLAPSATCRPVSLAGGEPVFIRVDGTTLTDWNRSPPMRDALADARAAIVLLPRAIADTDRAELQGVADSYDPGLGGRRLAAAAMAHRNTRSVVRAAEPNTVPPNQRVTGTSGVFVATSPDARPILVGGNVISGGKPDANWPTGARTDLDVMLEAISTRIAPIELDVSDIWRLDHERLPTATRDAFADDVLDNVVTPLIEAGIAAGRPVILLSVIPSLAEQRADRWRGAIAIVSGEGRGLLSSPIGGTYGQRRDASFAANATRPGMIDVSRVVGTLGFASYVGDGRDATCSTPATGTDIPGAAQDQQLSGAARVHDLAATILLGILTFAALLACWLLATARKAFTVRLILAVIAAAALLLPIAASIEGAFAGALAIRIAFLAAVIAPAAALIAWLPTRTALGVAGLAGAIGGLIELSRGGAEMAGSLLAAPLYRGIRSEGPDALLIGLTLVCVAVAASWWVDRTAARARSVTELLTLALGAALVLWFRSDSLPAPVVLLVAAGSLGFASLHRRRLARAAAFLALPLTFLAGMLSRDEAIRMTEVRVDELVLHRSAVQPDLWPLLALLTGLLLFVRLRLSERHADALARASFGAPAWRSAEAGLYVLAPIAAVTMAAGTYAAAVMTLLALLIGRIR